MGAALITRAVAWCCDQGVEMVDLWVVTDHHLAVRVYERAGFRICGTTRDGMRWHGVPQDEHQMSIHLALAIRRYRTGGRRWAGRISVVAVGGEQDAQLLHLGQVLPRAETSRDRAQRPGPSGHVPTITTCSAMSDPRRWWFPIWSVPPAAFGPER
jgi:hypothetical protein